MFCFLLSPETTMHPAYNVAALEGCPVETPDSLKRDNRKEVGGPNVRKDEKMLFEVARFRER
jgi:hypothetical protein